MPKNSKKKQTERKYPLTYLLPLVMVIAIIPLLIHQYNYNTGLTQYDWFQGAEHTSDMFLHVKMVWLYAMFIVILCFMIYMIFSEEIKPIWDRMLIPIFVYGGFSIISAIFSINRHYSFVGIHEQFEAVWMLLGYVLLIYYSFFILYQESAVKRLIPWLVAGITVMTLFGILQAVKLDPLRFRFFQKFILTNQDLIGKLKFSFEKGRAFLSLYNPNYVGFYVVMVVPILIALFLHTQKVIYRIGYGLLAAGMVFVLFASQSRAGILVLVVTFFIMLLCMREVFFKNWKLTLGIIVIVAVGFVGINYMNQNALLNRMRSMFDVSTQEYALESIEADEDVTFTYGGNEIHFTVDTDTAENATTFHVADGDGKPVLYTSGSDESSYVITDERFPFTFGVFESGSFRGFYVGIPQVGTEETSDETTRQWIFSNQMKSGDTSYYIKGAGKSFFHIKKYNEGNGFLEKHYQIANKRGYIWSRTLPLLKNIKYALLGSGPDTFVIAFPNDDLVGMYNSGHDREIITRPHCMYLQIAVQTGIPSLIAFLVFYGWYLIRSFRIYWKQKYDSYMAKLGVAVMVSVIGYLILGLTNDSCIAVSPIFFVITGLGMGINYHLQQTKQTGAK